MSYQNLMLYSRVLPTYDGKTKTDEKSEVINGDDPESFKKYYASIKGNG